MGGTPATDPIRRTALEYSNAIRCQRLPRTATDLVTCPNDPERPRRREFASRGSRGAELAAFDCPVYIGVSVGASSIALLSKRMTARSWQRPSHDPLRGRAQAPGQRRRAGGRVFRGGGGNAYLAEAKPQLTFFVVIADAFDLGDEDGSVRLAREIEVESSNAAIRTGVVADQPGDACLIELNEPSIRIVSRVRSLYDSRIRVSRCSCVFGLAILMWSARLSGWWSCRVRGVCGAVAGCRLPRGERCSAGCRSGSR